MMQPEAQVTVVDDDGAMREALQWLLESAGMRVATFSSAEDFLAAHRPGDTGCLLLDIRMRGMSGLELQTRLTRDDPGLPIIVITGHGDVPMAVRAMRHGAVDFLEKPVNDQVLVERVRAALELDHQRRQASAEQGAVRQRLATLTRREYEVMELVIAGKANKVIAQQLAIAEKTVEVHRKHAMDKMGVNGAVELLRVVLAGAPELVSATAPDTTAEVDPT